MTFREKTLWVSLITNVLVWGWYFSNAWPAVVAALAGTAKPLPMALLLPAIFVLVIVHIAAVGAIAIWRPAEANARLDERERAAKHLAAVAGYECLSFGLVLALGASLRFWNTYAVVNAIFFVFIVSECVRYSVEIVALRRRAA